MEPVVLTLVAIACLFTHPVPAAESLSVLLQKAIYAEETEGNLDSAIRIYEQISADSAANRPLVAQAQYRLAVCYQKQGERQKAVATFNELLKQFSSETALVHKARDHLGALGYFAPEALTLRKVADFDNQWFRAVSPDGSLIAYMGPDGEMLMQEPAAARTWQLFKCNWDTQPWGFVFSPDSRRVAYDTVGRTLFVANVEGSDVRAIFKPADNDRIQPITWVAATGQIIAVREEPSRGSKILVAIDPASGALKQFDRVVLSVGSDCYPSLNGRYAAVVDMTRLSVVDLESGRQEIVVDDHVARWGAKWARDDSRLFFCSDRGGNRRLCVIEMQAGKPVGEAKVIKEEGAGLVFEDVTPDGRIFYSQPNHAGNVCLASVNLETGEVSDVPRLVTNRFPGTQAKPLWSKDGSKLWLRVLGEQNRLVAISLPSGSHEDYPLAQRFAAGSSDYTMSPDASFALFRGFNFPKPGTSARVRGIHRYDMVTGRVETLARDSGGGVWFRQPRIAPDGRSFFYACDPRYETTAKSELRRTRHAAILHHDLVSGKVETIHEFTGERTILWHFSPIDPSPDGSRLAFVTSDVYVNDDFVAAIEILDLATRQTREVTRMAPREYVTSLGWTPDAKKLVYTKSTPERNNGQARNSSLWVTAIDSAKPVRINVALPELDDVAVSPDGRQIAFRTGTVGETAQLWVMAGIDIGQLRPDKPVSRLPVISQVRPPPRLVPVPPRTPFSAVIHDGHSLGGDGRGPYRDGANGSAVVSRQALGIWAWAPPSERPDASAAPPRERHLTFDLSRPVDGSGAVRLEADAENLGRFHVFWRHDHVPGASVERLYLMTEIPVGATVESDRVDMGLHVGGVQHLLQLGPWARGEFSSYASVNGSGTTKAIITRVSEDTWRITAPRGSVARLWKDSNNEEPVDQGLYYFDFDVEFTRLK